MFGEKPKKTRTPLVAGDHQENVLSDSCDQDQLKEYQTIVGQLIWLSGLGRFDIGVHVMIMSRFRQQPRVGHLERLKRIIGYLANFPHGSLRSRTHEPDCSNRFRQQPRGGHLERLKRIIGYLTNFPHGSIFKIQDP